MSASRTGHQGNGLYPIIRRVRRPLLPVDPPAETKPLPISQPEEPQPGTTAGSEVAAEKKTDASDSNK
jgi:hypothetical protein